MNRLFQWAGNVAGALAVGLLSAAPCFLQAQIVTIPDAGLQQAVRKALNKASGDITAADLASLTDLDAHSRGIRNLSGLQDAQNLKSLNLRFNGLTHLELPPGLSQLATLDAGVNQLTSVALPATATELTSINLAYNRLTELALPPGLVHLTDLDLTDNRVQDFFFLAGQTSLASLRVHGNRLTSFSLPPGLQSLEELDLGGNHLTDLSALAGRSSLLRLSLYNNGLSRLNLPPGLDHLQELNLGANRIQDVSSLAGHTSLVSLDLSDNALTELVLPGGFEHLRELNLEANQVTDLSGLAGLSGLTTANLRANGLRAVLLPSSWAGLVNLSLGANRLRDLSFLAGRSSLVTLDLSANRLTKLNLPDGLINLESLDLSFNQLTTVTLPAGLDHLRELILTGNPLHDLVTPILNGRGELVEVILDAPQPPTGNSDPLALKNVPEAANYTLVYSLDLPDQANFNASSVPYEVDNHATIGAFSRIGYYLELQPRGAPAQYLWVSMDAFTIDASKIGVPNLSSGAFFQQTVGNLNVRSSVPAIVTGDGLSGGNVEFWWGNYGKGNAAGVPGASDALFDFGDYSSPNFPGGYGSMQVHNAAAGQTLFAFNGWGEAPEPADLGIGNSADGYPDWTFAQNASEYSAKILQVYVLPSSGTPSPTSSGTVPEAADYTLVYSLNLPDRADYNHTGVAYDVDNHATVGPFSRIGYYLELQPSSGPRQFLWVSMDAFTQDASKVGVPTLESGAFFQQAVSNMNVRSSVPGVVTGDGLSGGGIEFWWADYAKANSAGVPGGSDTLFDSGDSASPTAPGGYGSMQVHNSGAGQTLFAFNGWGEAYDPVDLGIGNCPGKYPDWTFAANGASYTSKILKVYVLPAAGGQ